MSAKVVLCECPVCKTEFYARHDQMKAAETTGREVPCCSYKCDRERRYGEARDLKWKTQQEMIVNGLRVANK